MAHDVFITHSSKDKTIADAVCAALEAAKIRCWIAPRDILPGDKWAGSITKAIASSNIMVLIFSEHSNNSDDVLNELLLAKDAGAVIIPFKIGNIFPKGEMEYYLKRTHWLDAMNPPTEKQIQELVETVSRFIKTKIAEGKDKKDVTINGSGDYSTKSKETGSSSSTSTIDLTAQVEPVALAPHMEEQKEKGIFQKKHLIVAALIIMLLFGYLVLKPGVSDSPFSQKSTPSPIATIIQTPKYTPAVSPTPLITTASGQKTIIKSINMEFVLIPAGEFNMGLPSNDPERSDNEGPLHHVKISKAFYMGKYEVTQKQWRDVMGNNPSQFKGDDLPVEQVSWEDVQDFIKKLNDMEGTNKYRLPTEAEWEYAARAGTTTRYSFGNDESELGNYAWYSTNSGSITHKVGQKNPNRWGLYDTIGNVYEWVQDKYHDSYDGAPTDGSSWESGSGSTGVFRGGGFACGGKGCWPTTRHILPGSPLGFRLLRVS